MYFYTLTAHRLSLIGLIVHKYQNLLFEEKKIVIILILVHEHFKNTLIMSKLNSAINQSVNNAMWLRTFDEEIQIKSSEAINLHKADNNIKALRRRNFLYYI